MFTITLLSFLALAVVLNAQYTATYLPSNMPEHSEQGQTGTNQCGTQSNQTSQCQNAYLSSVDDFCLFAPPEPGPKSTIGNTERIETPDYVQVTGVGNLSLLNIPVGDDGGELDPHGADGNGNPIGALVFSSAFGGLEQIHEWTNFMSDSIFCFRACRGPNATQLCQHSYDVMGCMWVMPPTTGDTAEPMGIYGTSTFKQNQPTTPLPHPIPPSSSCTTVSSVHNGFAVSTALPSTTVALTASGMTASISPVCPVACNPCRAPDVRIQRSTASSTSTFSRDSPTRAVSTNGGTRYGVGGGWKAIVAVGAVGLGVVLAG
ncbi:hypothetical protein B0H21DRAFT_754840 [Amylocystis lapponica]|nr:hypothetical protein B0H21DRAFT_754840 [Amylocystis lapponica]